MFCKQMVRQHVLRRHKQEEEVKHIEDEKDEQKRKERLHRLRCKSYHQKNLGALQARKGEIILEVKTAVRCLGMTPGHGAAAVDEDRPPGQPGFHNDY